MAAVRDRGRDLRPVSVYRVLARLLSQGVIHRVQTLGAFVVCNGCHPEASVHAFAVCSTCRTVTEFDVDLAVAKHVVANTPAGFTPTGMCLEVIGFCCECARARHPEN